MKNFKRKKVKLSELQARRDRGLVCRACGCRQFNVVKTVPLPDGRIKRRRVCRHCGRPTATYEIQDHPPRDGRP